MIGLFTEDEVIASLLHCDKGFHTRQTPYY